MKKIKCNWCDDDWIEINIASDTVTPEDIIIQVESSDNNCIRLSPDKIRKLRKQLKKALLKIEGEKEEPEEWIPSKGDRVIFTDDSYLDELDRKDWHPKVGEIYVVREYHVTEFYNAVTLEETPDRKRSANFDGWAFDISGFSPYKEDEA